MRRYIQKGGFLLTSAKLAFDVSKEKGVQSHLELYKLYNTRSSELAVMMEAERKKEEEHEVKMEKSRTKTTSFFGEAPPVSPREAQDRAEKKEKKEKRKKRAMINHQKKQKNKYPSLLLTNPPTL